MAGAARKKYWGTTLILVGCAALVAWQFNLAGRLAFAIEQAVLQAVDDQLPTSDQLAELAKVNRLVVRRALPTVVHIMTTSAATANPHGEMDMENLPEEWRRYFERQFQNPQGPRMGLGSGVIIDAEQGYILTNNHVAGDAEKIEVRLPDGRRYDGKLIGNDPPTDIAVIQIPADNLVALPLGDSDQLEVGDPVMTIGNPSGLDGTVSQGIVSALNRSQLGIIDYEGFIQTDAVIIPGNSGGPMVNMRAEIVGINTAMQTNSGGFSGIGFAVPSSRIKKILPTLLKGEKVVRGYLGVEIASAKDRPEDAKKVDWDKLYGVVVSRVISGSPAEEAGIKANDVLTNLNGEPMQTSSQLIDIVAYTPPGATIVFDVWRDKKMVSLQLVVGRQPENFSTRPGLYRPEYKDAPNPEAEVTHIDTLGLRLETLSPQLVREYHLEQVTDQGAVVTGVEAGSTAEQLGVKPGEVLVAINGNPVQTAEQAKAELEKSDPAKGLDLRLRSAQGSRHLRLQSAH
ncbi:MAG: Periplasmic serine endoprotease DegP [Phycisphaerae bacterium]|nr:Periplasmic serine endoprotease DegP [Phycisphaerae bacterium]